MSLNLKKCHLLTIHDQSQKHEILLDETTYSIGRDANNKVVINHRAISRRHALLFRVPVNGEVVYRFLDGDETGRASANGTMINDKPCTMKDLQSGDTIILGKVIHATYQVISVEMKPETKSARELPSNYKSIKAPIKNPFPTVVAPNVLLELEVSADADRDLEDPMPTILMAVNRK